MRIYIAGFYASHNNDGVLTGAAGTEFSRVSAASNPAWVLESYHYMSEQKVRAMRAQGRTVFMDSGAFSMFTQKVTVSLDKYAEYLDAHRDIIHIASNLDEIGAGKEEQTYANQKYLEKLCKTPIQPVHHARDDDSWLQRYLAEGYDYIFLGGMVPETTQYLIAWLDRMWDQYLLNKDGTPKVKVHGFGLTTLELMKRYPWFSVDSTSWVMTSRFGGIYLDFPDGRVVKLQFSTKSPKVKDFDLHYDTLNKEARRAVDARLASLGFVAEDLRVNYGWRDRFNIEFFKRMQDRPTEPFHRFKGFFDE